MKKTDWKATAELIGIAAIVASLIFVGLELRQSHRIAIASQYQARIDANVQWLQNFREPSLIRTGQNVRRLLDHYELSPDVRERLEARSDFELGDIVNLLNQASLLFDNNHYQYQSGFVDEENWQTMRTRMQLQLSGSEFFRQHFFRGEGTVFRPSVIEEAKRMLEEVEGK
jgi:hypothetical protein